MSANAPAGSAKMNIGAVVAACTSDTIKGLGSRSVISQPDAALYIQPPILATRVAVQIIVKADWRNGVQGEITAVDAEAAGADASFSGALSLIASCRAACARASGRVRRRRTVRRARH